MRRQNIIIDDFTYIVDIYDAVEDLSDTPYGLSFAMIRNGNIVNNVFEDTDIVLIEKNIIQSCTTDNVIDLNKLNKIIAFPITSSSNIKYSTKYTDFNVDFNQYNFNVNKMIETIYDSNFNEAVIPCDKVRIYGPTINSSLNAIIDIETFMNGIHFHILCRKSTSLENDSLTEFKIGNFTYSEFMEVYIPNVNKLFEKNTYYYADIYGISSFKKKSIFSLVKTNTSIETESYITKKLNYVNGNFVSSEDCNIKTNMTDSGFSLPDEHESYDDEDANGSTLSHEEDDQTEQTQLEEHTHSGININIHCGNNYGTQTLVETTKYIISNQNKVTKTVVSDGTITIIQKFELTNQQTIQCKLYVIMSSILMWNKYNIKTQGISTATIVPSENSIIAEQILDNDIVKILIEDTITEDIVSFVTIDRSELKVHEGKIYCSMHLFKMPYMTEQSDNFKFVSNVLDNITTYTIHDSQNAFGQSVDLKTYYEDESIKTTHTANIPLKLTIYPISSTDSNGHYVSLGVTNSDVFSKNYHIILQNSFEFDTYDEHKQINDNNHFNGALYISSHFKYPDAGKYSNINEAYLDIMNMNILDYLEEIPNDNEFDTDEFPESIEKCGFTIEIATDKRFKNIVFSDVYNFDISSYNDIVIDDLTYTISEKNLNVNWKSYPDILIVRVKYYDKYSATVIQGNDIVISKEIFKYMLNDNVGKRINIKTLEDNDMNFIDKINCTIVRDNDKQQSSQQDSRKSSPRILYKPIFYKAKDLEQIKIKSGITQNIGLNLSTIMSKVDTFKIMIDGMEYPEIGRNDAYVIFKLNALEMKTTAGQYNLLNQDNEYISDGTWYLY